MSESKKLFATFDPLSKEGWKAIVLDDLRGEDFEDRLVWKTYENFSVQPYYTKEDIESHPSLDLKRTKGWTTYQEIMVEAVEQANKEAKTALSFGVEGLLFRIDNRVNIEHLLKGIDVREIAISFSGKAAIQSTRDYFRQLSAQNISLKEVSGFCDHDILGQWITSDTLLEFEELVDLVKITVGASNFRSIHIHSGDFVNSGSNFTQELAFTSNKVVEYIDQLTEAGLSLEEVLENIHLDMAITGDFFFEVAKQHAMRYLMGSILEAYGKKDVAIPIMASSSLWSKSRYDHHVNMIRNTTEAMSAILGGCDALLIRPHDRLKESPSLFSQRIASHISNLLKEESYFDKVDNPVSGSYYVAYLTHQLIRESLELFKQTEVDGGLISGIQSGRIQDQIDLVRSQKVQDLIDKKFVMVGANKYRVAGEEYKKASGFGKEEGQDGRKLLKPTSLSENVNDEKIL